MSTELAGRTALVTGSTSGIGRATAEKLASLGAHVIVSGRDAERGNAVAADIRNAGGTADFVVSDLGDAASVTALAEKALELGNGRVDILVNNAAFFPFGPLSDVTADVLDQVYAINVKAPIFLTQALAPAMADNGDGAVVNLSTAIASQGVPDSTIYASSKGAIDALTRTWAAELGPKGVRVNSVMPGVIVTPGTDALGPEVLELTKGDPANRPGQPEEVAAVIAFLATNAASYIHGVNIPVDGGAYATL